MIAETVAGRRRLIAGGLQLGGVIRIGTEDAAAGAVRGAAAVARLLLAVIQTLQYIAIVVAILGEAIVLLAVRARPARAFGIRHARINVAEPTVYLNIVV